jgi:hypothetical protein
MGTATMAPRPTAAAHGSLLELSLAVSTTANAVSATPIVPAIAVVARRWGSEPPLSGAPFTELWIIGSDG